MEFFLFLLSVKFIFLGAIYGRMDGGGIVKTPELLERILCMSFFVLACAPFAGAWSLIALAGIAGIATGHGQYFLARLPKYTKPEFFDFAVRPFFGADPRNEYISGENSGIEYEKKIKEYGPKKLYWRNVFGMLITGTIVGLGAFVVCLAHGSFFYGLLFLMTGVIKAISYILGWELFKSTEQAEYINGGARTALCVAVLILSLTSIIKITG